MTDYPIIFSAPMILALRASRKTMTRRLAWKADRSGMERAASWVTVASGDRLWVREAWRTEGNCYDDLSPAALSGEETILYDADAGWSSNHTVGRRRASFHMCRWASRLTLRITATKIERLQDISAADSIAEGVECETCQAMGQSACRRLGCFASQAAFAGLWKALHGPESWDANPEVVALTFTVQQCNIDQMKESA